MLYNAGSLFKIVEKNAKFLKEIKMHYLLYENNNK